MNAAIDQKPTITPVSDLANGFVGDAKKTGDVETLATSFARGVRTIVEERGWEADTAARCMISSVSGVYSSGLFNPTPSFLKPLHIVDVSARRQGPDGESIPNTIDDIDAAVTAKNTRLTKGIHAGLEKLELLGG